VQSGEGRSAGNGGKGKVQKATAGVSW
jgi:hypothetical protein